MSLPAEEVKPVEVLRDWAFTAAMEGPAVLMVSKEERKFFRFILTFELILLPHWTGSSLAHRLKLLLLVHALCIGGLIDTMDRMWGKIAGSGPDRTMDGDSHRQQIGQKAKAGLVYHGR